MNIQSKEYSKIRKGSKKFIENVRDRFNDFTRKDRRNEENLEEPVIVLEDRSFVKKAQIEENTYLKYCFDRFKEGVSDKLIVFGCSFKKDAHILEAIKSSKYKKVYVCFRPKEEKDFQQYFDGFHQERFEGVIVEDTQEHFFWEEHLPNECLRCIGANKEKKQ